MIFKSLKIQPIQSTTIAWLLSELWWQNTKKKSGKPCYQPVNQEIFLANKKPNLENFIQLSPSVNQQPEKKKFGSVVVVVVVVVIVVVTKRMAI